VHHDNSQLRNESILQWSDCWMPELLKYHHWLHELFAEGAGSDPCPY
jgi:hypothetical protein